MVIACNLCETNKDDLLYNGSSLWRHFCSFYKALMFLSQMQVEGIFRINADNGQAEHVRDQLNMGVVPEGIDVHCLAGLIKV